MFRVVALLLFSLCSVAAAPQTAEDACDGLRVSVAMSREKPCIKPGSGASFKDCANCPEMVIVPDGTFTMGSPSREPERKDDEGLQHRVTIPRPFAVGKFAVTFAEWDACAADGGCGRLRPDDKGWGRGDRPVINVNWNDAKAYAAWLSKKIGASYRLLSEAEREYVTRAGDGDAVLVGIVNHAGTGELRRRRRPLQGRGQQGRVPVQDAAGAVFQAEPMGALSGPRQCSGVG